MPGVGTVELYTAEQAQKLVDDEREACAAEIERALSSVGNRHMREWLSALIRSRGKR